MSMLDALIYGVRNLFTGGVGATKGAALPLCSDVNYTGGLQAAFNTQTEAIDVSLTSLSGVGPISFGPFGLFELTQPQEPGPGTSQGSSASLQAQQGMQQTGAAANNNGGPITIAGGAPGTGGSGAAALQGNVILQGGGQTVTVGPTGLSATGALDLEPITAPASPATGHFVLYVDVADNKLKAKSSAGTVTNLASP